MTDDLVLTVAKALHAADRCGSWDACHDKASWLRWARVAIRAITDARQAAQ